LSSVIGGRTPVEYIMSRPVYFVHDSDTVKEAYDKMREKNTKKILVKDSNQKPIGVLEGWKIRPTDFDKKVSQIALGRIELMSKDVDIDAVAKALELVSAVYITEKGDVVGVITAYDIFKSAV
jgi:predicted transcriptional regulator